MFGYVRPLTCVLTDDEREYYTAAYCGLCRAMGKVCGGSSRLTLSYDGVFLALLRIALVGEEPSVRRFSCPYAPLKRKNMLCESEALDYSAAAMGVLAALKLEDDIRDERGFRRAAARLAKLPARGWQRRADARVEGISAHTREGLEDFYLAEAENAARDGAQKSIDTAAEAFGELLGRICARGIENEHYAIAYSVGRHVGRWIYCIDALDDMSEDSESGRYNPFLAVYGGRLPSDEEKLTLECVLRDEAASALGMLELADIQTDTHAYRLLVNILNESLPRVSADVLAGRYRKPGREEIVRLKKNKTNESEGDGNG